MKCWGPEQHPSEWHTHAIAFMHFHLWKKISHTPNNRRRPFLFPFSSYISNCVWPNDWANSQKLYVFEINLFGCFIRIFGLLVCCVADERSSGRFVSIPKTMFFRIRKRKDMPLCGSRAPKKSLSRRLANTHTLHGTNERILTINLYLFTFQTWVYGKPHRAKIWMKQTNVISENRVVWTWAILPHTHTHSNCHTVSGSLSWVFRLLVNAWMSPLSLVVIAGIEVTKPNEQHTILEPFLWFIWKQSINSEK